MVSHDVTHLGSHADRVMNLTGGRLEALA
jgi:ABC-type sulfate/molybdate transport systems ATPase subunit